MSTAANWIYLDSTILVGAVLTGVSHSAAVRAYCRELAAQQSTVLFSSLALLEFGHIVRSLGNPNERRRLPDDVIRDYDLENWATDLAVRERWTNDATAKLDALLDEFAVVYEVPVLPEYWHDVTRLMIGYDLRSFDALHLVTALRHGVSEFATSDRHFLGIDEPTVHIVRDS